MKIDKKNRWVDWPSGAMDGSVPFFIHQHQPEPAYMGTAVCGALRSAAYRGTQKVEIIKNKNK